MNPVVPLFISIGLAMLLAGGSTRPVEPTLTELEAALDATAQEQYGNIGPMASDPAYKTFLRMEPTNVPDHMLVAILLAGSTRRSPVDVAQDLLRQANGDVTRMASAHVFDPVPGVGDSGRARLLASTELARRIVYRTAADTQKIVEGVDDAVALLRALSVGSRERLSAIYLDRRNRVVGSRLLSVGSDGLTVVDPRMVIGPAVELRATGIILAHQHPSGDPRPSPQDRDVTERVSRAARIMGIRLLDHIVLGSRGRYTSLQEEGLLSPWGTPQTNWTF